MTIVMMQMTLRVFKILSGWYGTKSCVPVCVFGFFVLCVCVCNSFHPELGQQQDSKGAKLKLSSHSDSNVDKQGSLYLVLPPPHHPLHHRHHPNHHHQSCHHHHHRHQQQQQKQNCPI